MTSKTTTTKTDTNTYRTRDGWQITVSDGCIGVRNLLSTDYNWLLSIQGSCDDSRDLRNLFCDFSSVFAGNSSDTVSWRTVSVTRDRAVSVRGNDRAVSVRKRSCSQCEDRAVSVRIVQSV